MRMGEEARLAARVAAANDACSARMAELQLLYEAEVSALFIISQPINLWKRIHLSFSASVTALPAV